MQPGGKGRLAPARIGCHTERRLLCRKRARMQRDEPSSRENNAEESQAIANVLVIAAWGGALVAGVGVFMPRPSSDEDDGSDKISPQRFLVRTIGISVVVGTVALLLVGLLLGLGFWAASQGW